MRYLHPFKVLDSSGSVVYDPNTVGTCPGFQTNVAPNKFMYNQSADPLGYCQYDCKYWCPGFDCTSACNNLLNQQTPAPFLGQCACFNNNIAANAEQYLNSNSGNPIADCTYDCAKAYNCTTACPGFDCYGACSKLLSGGSVAPPGTLAPVTMQPGTLPPGTLPPGTLPPGTLAPVTMQPGTLPPGTTMASIATCQDFNNYVVPYLDYSNPDPSMCNTECNHYCSSSFDCKGACNNALNRVGSSFQNMNLRR
jgi:hypothetical protein